MSQYNHIFCKLTYSVISLINRELKMYLTLVIQLIILTTMLSNITLEPFPFEEYWIASTVISNLTRFKRSPSLPCEQFDLKLKSYIEISLCLYRKTVMTYKFLNHGSKLVVHEQDGSMKVTPFSNLNYTILTGYVIGYENSSDASGLLYNDIKFIGTISINGTVLYIEDLTPYENVLQLELKTTQKVGDSVIYKQLSMEGYQCQEDVKIPKWRLQKLLNICESSKLCNNKATLRMAKNLDYSGVEAKLDVYIDTSYFKYSMSSNERIAIYSVMKSIETADAIFRSTDFMRKGSPNNVGFQILNVTLFKESATSPLPEFYPYKRESGTTVDLFDDVINKHDYLPFREEQAHLNILYTGQAFQGGTVGIAFSASAEVLHDLDSNSSTGKFMLKPGLCAQLSSTGGDLPSFNTRLNEFNSLLVTSHNGYMSSLTQLHLDLTLTHELGHIFGSLHDRSSRCGKGYLMSDRVGKWVDSNMYKFSRCSRYQINRVLADRHTGCLSLPSQSKSICGNKLTEGEEQCDCGNRFECSVMKSCCFPHGSRKGTPCTLKPNCK